MPANTAMCFLTGCDTNPHMEIWLVNYFVLFNSSYFTYVKKKKSKSDVIRQHLGSELSINVLLF